MKIGPVNVIPLSKVKYGQISNRQIVKHAMLH